MGKSKKRKHALFHAATKVLHEEESNGKDPGDDLGSVVSAADLQTTIDTLQILTEHGELLQGRAFKDLRRALHPIIVAQMRSYDQGTDYKIKATHALQNLKWSDALAALQGCQDFQQIPKQGTIQRWVRDCDQAPTECKITLLNAILQVNGHSSNNKHDVGLVLAERLKDGNSSHAANGGLLVLDSWRVPGHASSSKIEKEEVIKFKVPLSTNIIFQEKASERKPPNEYDLLLHSVTPDSIQWSDPPPTINKHIVPFVDDVFLLDHVLTRSECNQLRSVATMLGYRPDHPVTVDKPTGIDSCEWLVDASIMDPLNERVKSLLPPIMKESAVVHSINSRWRFFRYSQDSVYRPHIDGSWPESRINEKGEYEYDESGSVKSYLTFLIYLNDDFEGGETLFYIPSSQGMSARGVVPKAGAVLVFPQGNTASLIHEGSAVANGTKYVVRTDVLYRVKGER